ncbi:MAG: discoidin domain-containing protein, partial [Gemmatimonadota bacterium]
SDVGYMLEFQLTVVSPLEGTGSDIATVYVYAPNPPAIPPPNVRALPMDFGALGLGFTLRWDELFDANSYQLALKLGDAYFWIYNTTETSFEFSGMAENAEQIVAVRGMNDYPGDGVQSEDMPYVALSNVAPVASASFDYEGNPVPGMNDGAITDNNSWGTSVQTEDLWGYQWDAPQIFDHVVYYTGAMGTYGGWFTDLKVQCTQDGTTWENVPIMDIFPLLDLTDQRAGKEALTRYDISIPTVSGTGIRIYGTPGGAGTYTSIAELDVFGNQQASQPVVYGLDATFGERSTAVLDGSYSFSTAGPLSGFEWQQVIVGGEPAVTIADPTQAKTSFEAPGVDADTVFSFTFTAGDGVGTDTDDVTITIKNLVTTAVAGPDQVAYEGTTVTLDGNGSMTTTGDLTFSWTQKEGTIVALDGANTATPSFTTPAIWGYNEDLVFDL